MVEKKGKGKNYFYEVESIKDKKIVEGKTKYLIKW